MRPSERENLILLRIEFNGRVDHAVARAIGHDAAHCDVMRQGELQRFRHVAGRDFNGAFLRFIPRFFHDHAIRAVMHVLPFIRALAEMSDLCRRCFFRRIFSRFNLFGGKNPNLRVINRFSSHVLHMQRDKIDRQAQLAEILLARLIQGDERLFRFKRRAIGMSGDAIRQFQRVFAAADDAHMRHERAGCVGFHTRFALHRAFSLDVDRRVWNAVALAVGDAAFERDDVRQFNRQICDGLAALQPDFRVFALMIPLFFDHDDIRLIRQIRAVIHAGRRLFSLENQIGGGNHRLFFRKRHDRAGNDLIVNINHLDRDEIDRQLNRLKLDMIGCQRQFDGQRRAIAVIPFDIERF